MRTATTIFLLILVGSIQTPLGQFFKIPMLIEHFNKHQQQGDVSLIGFLQDHYSSDHNDADLPEDEQLPFKNIPVYSIGYAVVPDAVRTHVFICLPRDKKIIFPETYTLQQHLDSIFHPPRA
jgi:hypothetical protein